MKLKDLIKKQRILVVSTSLILVSCSKVSSEVSYNCGFYQVTISADKKILTQKRSKPVDNYERYFYAEDEIDNKISFLDGDSGYFFNSEDETLYTYTFYPLGVKEYCTKKITEK